MDRLEHLQTVWTELRALGRMLSELRRPRRSPSTLLDERAAAHGDRLALVFPGRRYTWSEVDGAVNRAANAFREMGVARGDVVALMMDNRPELVFAITALSRLRAVSALINTNIRGTALAHAVRVSEATRCLVGSEHETSFAAVLGDIEGLGAPDVWVQADPDTECTATAFSDFDELLARHDETRPPSAGTPDPDDRMCFIYTSGTTGLPKAAIITHKRFLSGSAMLGRGMLELTADDTHYITTPLYHSVAMFAGWGAALLSGSCMAFRRKFSVSAFWDDVCDMEATAFVHIGELCRYLLNQPVHPRERSHKLRIVVGNGLRPDIWEEFVSRFAIPKIREYYGATEGSSATANFTGRPGMVGRLVPGQALVRCDPETGEILRNAEGRCERIEEGETGLLISRINAVTSFDGYVDREATQKKILENVFKSGDRYFNTGDLLSLHEYSWLSFADRVGDTFRWKGENVSTNEVAEILNGAPGVLETNVYGVQIPGTDGRAGMAGVHCGDGFSIEEFARFVITTLPGYQRPIFVRLQKDMRITVTFKHQKVDYRREGYDPTQVSDPLFFLKGDTYVPLDEGLYEAIQKGDVGTR